MPSNSDDPEPIIPGGYSVIVEKLVDLIGDRADILTNTEVVLIDWTNDDNVVKVHCDNCRVFEADYVIVTVSLGVLKQHHKTLFSPQLPEEKVSAVDSMAFGSISKIFLGFDEAFWDEELNGFELLHPTEHETSAVENSEMDVAKQWFKSLSGFNKVRF